MGRIDKIGGFVAFDEEPTKQECRAVRQAARKGDPGPSTDRQRPAVLQPEARRCRDALAYAQQEVVADLTPLKVRADELEAILPLGVLRDDALVLAVAELARIRASVQMMGNAWNAKSRQIVATFEVRWQCLAAEFATHYRFPNHIDRIDLTFPVTWTLADASDAFEFQFSAPAASPIPVSGPVVPDDPRGVTLNDAVGELSQPSSGTTADVNERPSGDAR